MKASRILLASSDTKRRTELRFALECEGHAVTEAHSVAQVLPRASHESTDLLIVACPVEGTNPHRLCRMVRSRSKIAIAVIGDNNQIDAIDALNAGADEYVSVPYSPMELMARVRALLRRVTRSGGKQIQLHDRAIDLDTHRIRGPQGRVSHLTPKEHLVLQYLLAHVNQPRTHRELAQTIWQRDGLGEVEYVRVVIQQLRRKLEPSPASPRYLVTERSVGYRFQIPAENAATPATA